MTISGSDPIHDLNQALFGIRRPQGGDTRSGDTTSPSAGNSGDTVALSQEIKEREALVSQIQALPDVRIDQVSPLKEALAAGRFHIDGERLAAGVIRETVLNAVA